MSVWMSVAPHPLFTTTMFVFAIPLSGDFLVVYHHDNWCLGVTVTFVTSQLRQQLCATVTGPVWQWVAPHPRQVADDNLQSCNNGSATAVAGTLGLCHVQPCLLSSGTPFNSIQALHLHHPMASFGRGTAMAVAHAYALHTQVSMDFFIYLVQNLMVSCCPLPKFGFVKEYLSMWPKPSTLISKLVWNTLYFIMLLLLIPLHLLTYCQ